MIYVGEGEDKYVTETVYDRETGIPRRQWTILNGKRESPPDDSPSHISYDKQGRIRQLHWHKQDKGHRENGPSSIVINPESGVHTCETFELHGVPRAPDIGPYRVYRDKKSGEIWRQESFEESEKRDLTEHHGLEP